MKVAFIDLSRQYQSHKIEIDEAVKRVFTSGRYILGREVGLFEKEFAEYIGVPYAVGVASGTEAITLALWALGIKEGNGVVVPANSLPSVWGVIQAGARPILCDIDQTTYNLDPQMLEEVLRKKQELPSKDPKGEIKAILAVHLYGRPATIEKIMAIAKKFSLYVVEDCAQACGAEIKSKVKSQKSKVKKVGSVGHAGIFSFYPTKNLGGYGDGGIVVTKSKRIAQRVRLLRMYGEKPRYQSQMIGLNSRLDELQAAILRVKLKYLDEWNRKRKAVAATYSRYLSSLPVGVPRVDEGHVFHLYVIRSKRRDELRKYLARKGIATMIHYPLPIHLQPSLKYLGYKKRDFPVTEQVSKEILSLPIYPEMGKKEVTLVCRAIKEFFDHGEN